MTEKRSRAADEKFCPACGEIIHANAHSCPRCGAPQAVGEQVPPPPVAATPSQTPRAILGADEEYCASCGSVVKKMAEVCPSCGVRHGSNLQGAYTGAEKNKWLAVALAVFLGSIGIHKFYLGKYAQGFIYLALCWTTVPFFIGLFEALIYAFTPQESFSQRYAQNR
jgi:TM2 domain-containing membrane protein YozV/RNA polymerase subunit RPABC4/transcription elongation factor Spt4